MNVKQIAIEGFSRFILGGLVWARLKHIVEMLDDSDLSNTEKFTAAKEDAKAIGIGLCGFLLNLGIELAVAFLRTSTGSTPPS